MRCQTSGSLPWPHIPCAYSGETGPKILNSHALLASAYRLGNQQDRKVTVPSKWPLELLDRKAVIDQQILNLGCLFILVMIIMKSTLSGLMDVDKVLENEERKPPI